MSQKTTIQIIYAILIIKKAVILMALVFVFLVSHPFSSNPLNGPFLFEYSLTLAHNFLYELSPTASNLKAEAVCSSETMVTTYKARQRTYVFTSMGTSNRKLIMSLLEETKIYCYKLHYVPFSHSDFIN
jgi:hypothetical protein